MCILIRIKLIGTCTQTTWMDGLYGAAWVGAGGTCVRASSLRGSPSALVAARTTSSAGLGSGSGQGLWWRHCRSATKDPTLNSGIDQGQSACAECAYSM